MGMPHSEFLAWEPEDRAKALSWLFEENARCQMCGTSDWEWDPEQGGSRNAYEPVLRTCWGCYYKEISREGQDIGAGVTVSLEKPGTITAAKRAVLALRLSRRSRQAERDAAKEKQQA